ncbi:MAG: hypothetical protein HY583_01205 [Candidatus Omnitrophica bacterium]|nr:hypothetical protein [Candidatus Omnitrophota bacterium]
MKAWLRIWAEKELTDVEKHLLIIGDAKGDCASCRELGLDYKTVKQCPHCQTNFTYVTCRRFETHPLERFQIVKRLSEARNDLVWIDYDDYKKLTGRQKARDFFSG